MAWSAYFPDVNRGGVTHAHGERHAVGKCLASLATGLAKRFAQVKGPRHRLDGDKGVRMSGFQSRPQLLFIELGGLLLDLIVGKLVSHVLLLRENVGSPSLLQAGYEAQETTRCRVDEEPGVERS